MTGSEPISSNQAYTRREPKRSHSGPIIMRTTTVMATDAIIVFPTWALVRIFTDQRHQRRNTKPAEETQKEGEPGHVKGPHLRGCQAEQIDFRGFVFDFHIRRARSP